LPPQSKKVSTKPPTANGSKNLLKLIPLLNIATTSDLPAILDVKNITEINTNKGKSMASICGINPR
jgi:hypothetical protein